MGYLMPKPSWQKEEDWYKLTYSWEDRMVHTFSESIKSKVNVIVWLEFKLAFYNIKVQHINNYTMKTNLQMTLSKTVTSKLFEWLNQFYSISK